MIDILSVTVANIRDKRLRLSAIEYKCELEPLWLTASLVRELKMGRVHVQGFENGLVRARSGNTLRKRK
jgi:hypothetical protein